MEIAMHEIVIKDIPFEFKDGTTSPKTVEISLKDNYGELISKKKYGFVESEKVFEKIKNKETISYTNAYFNGFSIGNYRKNNKLNEIDIVEINAFKCIECYFDFETQFDFSHIKTQEDFVISKSFFAKGLINFYKTQLLGLVDFSETVFSKGNINFHFVEYGNNGVNFENVIFNNGNINFVNNTFGNGTINFKEVSFGTGNVDFHFSKFGNGLKTFDKSVFMGGDVDFSKTDFGEGKLDFKRVNFGDGKISFQESEVKSGKMSFKSSYMGDGEVTFESMDFGKDEANFDQVNFGSGNVSFKNVKAKKLSFQNCHFNNYMDFRVDKVETIDMSDSILRDVADFRTDDNKVEIQQLNISGMRNLGQIYINWKENKCYHLIKNQKDSSNKSLANQFRLLKENFNGLGEYNDEDEAYVQFKRHELRADLDELKTQNFLQKTIGYLVAFFQWLIFDKIGKYATDPVRVLISSLIIYTLFSLVYYFLPYFANAEIIQSVIHPDHLYHDLKEAFYHSAVTYLTIGYGDFFPSGHFKWISALEGWVGIFLTSYFTVAFVRKILR
jgi:hypothetical protein